MNSHRLAGLALLSMTAAACAPGNSSTPGQAPDAAVAVSSLQAVGDSILEWNTDTEESIPEVVGAELGTPVENNSVGGATMLGEDPIGQQFRSGSAASHVLVTGGGNDLAEACDPATTERLISADLTTGAMVELADMVDADRATTVIIGYYRPLPGTEYDCPEIARTMSRYEEFADARPDVLFVPTDAVVTPNRPEYYADAVHPTPAGGRAVGVAIAGALRG